MKKVQILVLIAVLLTVAVAAGTNNNNLVYSTPTSPAAGKKYITLYDVWPKVDELLRREYWFYLKDATTQYQAGVDSPKEFLFFTIYRNIVGTFLVITTWTKGNQKTQINTFVRLGNGYAEGSGANYDPVKIDPFIVSLALGPDEYMVAVNPDGTVTVTGNMTLYNQINGINGKDNNANAFNITADMKEKCGLADKFNRENYWMYLQGADLISESNMPTSEQYYCVFVYVNTVGTFLTISHWDLATKKPGVNTLVRLGNGKADGANYGPVNLAPSILKLEKFN